MIKAGELLFFGDDRRFRVLDVVPFEEEDESPFVGLLQVESGLGVWAYRAACRLVAAVASSAESDPVADERADCERDS